MARLPDFLIAGTQKGGTTWLEHQLAGRSDVFTPGRQLHFFDRNFERGAGWYAAQFSGAVHGQVLGEKTTEYFDTQHEDRIAERIARTLPQGRVIVILRDPVARALSAFAHMVYSGREPLSGAPDQALFADAYGWRYVQRGYYSQQLEALYRHVPRNRVLVLIFEEDVIADPSACWTRVCGFLGLPPSPASDLDRAVNTLRLSAPAARLSRWFLPVPYARGAIRRIDRMLGLPAWRPAFAPETRQRLAQIYAPHNRALFQLIGREIPSWTAPCA